MKSRMSTPATPLHTHTHFARLGGHDAVVSLVNAFYRAMDTRPEARSIRAMHEADLTQTKAILVKYFSEWLGGPRLFTPERGAPALRRRHQPFAIDSAARDAWMLCMRQALAEVCTDDSLRAEIDAALYKVADFMRNTEDPSLSHH
jgi:hemoglobin